MEIIKGVSTKNIDHLGIVAGVCDKIGLVALIDDLTNSDAQRKVSVGLCTKAMILNGLGFVNRTLYLTPQFFSDKPVELLLGSGVQAADLHSHSLGTALDALYKAGISRVFFNVSLKAIKTYGITVSSRHLDGTSLAVHGNGYEAGGAAVGQIELKQGYNKQKRSDLRQFIVELICSDVEGIPLYLKAASGNKTDKEEFPVVLEAYLEQMKQSQEQLDGPLIADSALYTAQTIEQISKDLTWISRVPNTLKDAQEVTRADANRQWQTFEASAAQGLESYKYMELGSTYGGVNQRWFVIHSAAARKRSEQTVNKGVEKQRKSLEKGVKQLRKKSYETEQAARQAVQDWYDKTLKNSQKQYHELGQIEVEEKQHYGRGRRAVNAKPVRVDYHIAQVELQVDKEAVEAKKEQKAQFILATNEVEAQDLSPQAVLLLYKDEQQKVERGFRFLKDPMFLLSHIFLELPRRIMALSMVMGLCLLIYTLAQHVLRKALKDRGETIPNQLNKPITNPTMRWVFQLFTGIHVLYVAGQKKAILNLNATQIKLLGLLDSEVQSYYTVG